HDVDPARQLRVGRARTIDPHFGEDILLIERLQCAKAILTRGIAIETAVAVTRIPGGETGRAVAVATFVAGVHRRVTISVDAFDTNRIGRSNAHEEQKGGKYEPAR